MLVRQLSTAALAMFVLYAISLDSAMAQRPKGNAVEVATMAGVIIMKGSSGADATEIAIPAGASTELLLPSLRLTFWSPGSLAIETAVSFAHLSSGGHDGTLAVFEVGPSFALPSRGSTMASIGGVVGILSATNGSSESDIYLGPQIIVRNRIRDYAVARFQGGVRIFAGDDFGIDYGIEFAGGVGFFL